MADVGRKSKMTPEAVKTAIKLAQEQKSIRYICSFLEIDVQTYYNWSEKCPELRERVNEEKRLAEQREIEAVRKALLKRAKGYKTREKKERFDAQGNLQGYELTTKEVPADVKAQTLFLTNRDPEHWKTNPSDQINTEDGDNSINITIDD